MKMIWDEERIRAEIKQLDQKVGLCGALLPIRFNNSKCTLGCFCFVKDRPAEFVFSNHYFQSPDFPTEDAIDIIRHEYAHYMDCVLHGNSGHGSTWKQCCVQVGALPLRLYHENDTKYRREKQESERQENLRMDRLSPGVTLLHPKYGSGVITAVKGEALNRLLQVDFPNVGQKTLGATWVLQNCQFCTKP